MGTTRSLRIVVADDELDIRDYFKTLLPRLGHEVVGLAENGRQLVELCASEHPDLVITDVTMPEMDGLEAAERIARTQDIPIIIVSAHQRDDSYENRLIVEYLVKPVSMAEISHAIDRVSQR